VVPLREVERYRQADIGRYRMTPTPTPIASTTTRATNVPTVMAMLTKRSMMGIPEAASRIDAKQVAPGVKLRRASSGKYRDEVL
jgi:hypothetical protein